MEYMYNTRSGSEKLANKDYLEKQILDGFPWIWKSIFIVFWHKCKYWILKKAYCL